MSQFGRSGWRRLFRLPWSTRRSVAAEVDSELEFHLQMRTAELVARGMSEPEARAEALLRFGDLAEARETMARRGAARARRTWWATWLRDLGADAGFAVRAFRRRPGLAAVAISTIALGIGLTTTVLAVVNRLVLRPLPYPGSDRFVTVWLASEETSMRISPTLQMLAAWRRPSPTIEWIEAHDSEELLLESGETAELVPTRSVTPGLLSVVGGRVARGRGIEPADTAAGATLVTVLSWDSWRRRFGGAEDAIGRSVSLDGRVATVIGVMERGFDLSPMDAQARAEFWLPLGGPGSGERSASILLLRRPGAHTAAITRELRASLQAAGIISSLTEKFPPTASDPSEFADPGRERTLWLLTFAVSLVLAVACANVAALLLGQSAARAQEFGVRAALGAGRGRVVRQLVTEALVLGALGGFAGIVVAKAALRLTRWLRPDPLLALDDVALEPRVLLFAVGVTLAVAILFGLAPAWAASRGDVAAVLVGRIRRSFDTRFGRSLRGALVAGQLAASLVLVSGAGVLLRSFLRERSLPIGFRPEGLGWVDMSIPERLIPEPAVRDAIAAEVAAAVAGLPGVEAMSIAGDLPLGYGIMQAEFLIEGRPLPVEPAQVLIPMRAIGPGYFETIGMGLVAGRPLDSRPESAEIVIDAETARRLWPRGDAVGGLVRFSRDAPWRTIVGVAPEQRALIGGMADAPFVFQPIFPGGGRTVIVRWRGPGTLERVSATIRSVDSRIRIRSVVSAEAALDERLAGRRFTMTIVTAFAGLAMLLAAVGLYGVVALAVSQRTYELGVRLALGAAPGTVRLMVLREGARRVALGLLLGLILAVASSRLLRGLLADVPTWDPAVWTGAAVVMAVAGVLACWVPARRASRIDPLVALRVE